LVARGAAYADIDRDGDLDLVINNNHTPAALYRNEGGHRGSWISFRLEGVASNRSALGAVVRIESAGGKQWRAVASGGSYCSQSTLDVHFGLGGDAAVKSVEIEWPSGKKQRFTGVAARKHYGVREDADKLVEK
jgi:hypothetical protein